MATKAKKLTAMLLAVLTMLSAAACGSTDNGKENVKGQSAGKELEQGIAADDVFTLNYNKKYSLNPLTATNTNNQLVCNLLYENMIELDNNFKAVPNVITEWASEDGIHWKFTVDTSRRFHNGEQMTARDVAYSLSCAMNSERFGRRLFCVIGCSANDDKTFNVTLSKENRLLPELMAVPIIKNGSFNKKYPDGTGPYKWNEDRSALVKFDGYPNAATLPFDTVYLKEYSGVDEIISAYEDSRIDIVMNDPSAPTNLGYGSANEIRGLNTANLHFIGTNMLSSEMSFEGLRYALNFAFDREALVEQFGGFAAATTLAVHPACAAYDKTYAKQFRYDLKEMQKILTNMGLKDYDMDGMLEMKLGGELKEIDIDFVVCNASAIKTTLAHKFAEDMASIGIKVSVRELPWGTYVETLEAGNFDIYYAEVRLNPDFDMSMLFRSEAKLNYGGVIDTTLDELIAAYLAANNDNDRRVACGNMCAQIANKGYIIPLCYERHQMITHRAVIDGIKANENNPLCNVQNWKVSFTNVQKTDEK